MEIILAHQGEPQKPQSRLTTFTELAQCGLAWGGMGRREPLIARRRHLDFTQESLAHHMNVSVSAVTSWEHGNRLSAGKTSASFSRWSAVGWPWITSCCSEECCARERPSSGTASQRPMSAAKAVTAAQTA
jgi:hypothetical protein